MPEKQIADNLRQKAGTALFWSFLDRGGQQFIQFIFGVILARWLGPEVLGLWGIVYVFTIFANILQESGFTSALIRKKDVDETDYSSVFYFNIAIGFFLYIGLFIASPFIASYFDASLLENMGKIAFLSFVFNAFGVVQNAHLIRRMDFKTNAKINFLATIISGITAVIMAYKGYGVWSLVIQLVLQALIRALLLWGLVRWYPKATFVLQRIRSMFSYSVNLLINSLFNQTATKIYSIVIGKYYTFADVGLYDQANKFNYIPQSTIGSSIQSVLYPVLTKIDTEERTKRVFRKAVRVASFISFPCALFIIIAAEPIILTVISDKWINVIPLLRILCVGGAFYPSYCLISSLLQSLGKSALLLRIELSKNILYIVAVFFTINLGLIAMVTGISIINVVTFLYGYYFSGKYIHYKLTEVFKDIFPYILISVVIFFPLYFLSWLPVNNFLLLVMQAFIGGGLYLLVVKILGSQVLEDTIQFVKNNKLKNKL